MRRQASHTAEMVNQLLFGDTVALCSATPGWLQVRTLADNYEGWVQDKQLLLSDAPVATDCVVPTESAVVCNGMQVTAPAGASCRQAWLVGATPQAPTHDIVATARTFLGAPYLWGGRSKMGIDCSGLAQVVFKICGIALPRDAWQQASAGTPTTLEQSQPGDLAFFSNPQGRIIHVGIVSAPHGTSIIHASGRVREDRLDSNGILDDNNTYTHHLATLRHLLQPANN